MAFEFTNNGSKKKIKLPDSLSLGSIEQRESEMKFSKYRKPIGQVNRPAFSSTADRFENHTSLRADTTVRHKLHTQDLGPGTHEIRGLYEHQLAAPSVMGKVKGASLAREDRKMLLKDMQMHNNTAPGCYEIPSYFKSSHQHRQLPGSVGGSSSFLNSGRKTEILPDGKYFQSAHPETRTDHMGPGYYQTPMTIGGQLPPNRTVFPGTPSTHYAPDRSMRMTAKLDMTPPKTLRPISDPAALSTLHPGRDPSHARLGVRAVKSQEAPFRPAHSNFAVRQMQLANEDIDAVRDLPMDMFFS